MARTLEAHDKLKNYWNLEVSNQETASVPETPIAQEIAQ